MDLVDESPFHLVGAFPGPSDTPYEGGHYEVVCSADFDEDRSKVSKCGASRTL